MITLSAGWEGSGLGTMHQGIQEPIKGGDVRDKTDKYKVQTWLPSYQVSVVALKLHVLLYTFVFLIVMH